MKFVLFALAFVLVSLWVETYLGIKHEREADALRLEVVDLKDHLALARQELDVRQPETLVRSNYLAELFKSPGVSGALVWTNGLDRFTTVAFPPTTRDYFGVTMLVRVDVDWQALRRLLRDPKRHLYVNAGPKTWEEVVALHWTEAQAKLLYSIIVAGKSADFADRRAKS